MAYDRYVDWNEENILSCCYISSVVYEVIHKINETWATINIRSTAEVAT